MHCSTILKQNNIFLFTYLTLSLSLSLSLISFLSPQRPLSLITSLSHGGLLWLGSWVRSGGETGEVEISVVWWQSLGFLGPNQRGMISGMFKFFLAWFVVWFPFKKCRQIELYLPWKCETGRNIYEKCEYELVMERMKFWVLLKPSCEI